MFEKRKSLSGSPFTQKKSGDSAREALTHQLAGLGYQVEGLSDRSGLLFTVETLVSGLALNVIDVGSSDGELAEIILKSGKGKVLSLEPNSQFKDKLDRLRAEFEDRFAWHDVAAGEKDGYTSLRYNPADPTSGTTSSSEQVNEAVNTNALSKRVNRTTLDDLVNGSAEQFDVVIIDTPGSVEKVLRGMKLTLRKKTLEIVIAAIAPVPARGETSLTSIAALLDDFDAYRVLPGRVGIEKLSTRDKFFDLPFGSFILFSRINSNSGLLARLKAK